MISLIFSVLSVKLNLFQESFYNFCRNIGGETEEVMCEILAVIKKIYFCLAILIYAL